MGKFFAHADKCKTAWAGKPAHPTEKLCKTNPISKWVIRHKFFEIKRL